LLALAMGVQSAGARQVGRAAVAASYVTSTVVSIAAGWVGLARRGTSAPNAGSVALQVADWVVYALGAAGGGFLLRLWAAGALVPPLLVLVVVAAGGRAETWRARSDCGSPRTAPHILPGPATLRSGI
jgi:uncharacterized membrane protein YoaK (UPF0700 family)